MWALPILSLLYASLSSAFIVGASWKGSKAGRFTKDLVARKQTTTSHEEHPHTETDASLYQDLCVDLGVQPGSTYLQSSDIGSRGVYVAAAVAAGEPIMKIPITDNWLRDDVSPIATLTNDDDASYPNSQWASRLAAAFLQRQAAATDASFELYASLLPDPEILAASLPLNWDTDLLTFAASTALEIYVDSAFFVRAEAVDEVLLHMNTVTREQVQYALDIVQTRSCRLGFPDGQDIRCLVPVFDFINHSNKPNAAFFLQGQTLVVSALCDLEANEQVFIDYGASARPAARCLASYGFVPDFYPEDESATAEVYLDGVRYEVGTSSIPEGMVAALMVVEDRRGNLSDMTVLTPEIAKRLARRLADVSFQLLLNPLEGEEDDDTASGLLSAYLAKSLRWYQHRVLDACSAGLWEWAVEQTQEQLV